MKKIRVLQIISSSNIGGGEKIVYSLLKYLDKDKFEFYVACPPDGPMFSHFKKYAKEVKACNFRHWFFNPHTIFSLKRYMEQRQIDIVHTHLYAADFIGIIAAVFAGIRRRVVSVGGYNFSRTGRFDLRSIKNFFCSLIYRSIYIFSDVIIAVSQAVKQDLIKRPGIKPKEEKIKVIHAAVDLLDVDKRSQDTGSRVMDIDTGGKDIFIGVVANFDKVKGHHILLRAIPKVVKELENVEFIFIGSGEERYCLEQTAKRLNIKNNIIFTGVCQNPAAIVRLCDLVVLPSLVEGLSLALLEAMVLAKPVVASNIGGIPEVVENGVTGLLVPPGDSAKLAEAILYLLKDKALASKMGQRGRARVQKFFDLKDMMDATEKIYFEAARRE